MKYLAVGLPTLAAVLLVTVARAAARLDGHRYVLLDRAGFRFSVPLVVGERVEVALPSLPADYSAAIVVSGLEGQRMTAETSVTGSARLTRYWREVTLDPVGTDLAEVEVPRHVSDTLVVRVNTVDLARDGQRLELRLLMREAGGQTLGLEYYLGDVLWDALGVAGVLALLASAALAARSARR